MQSMSKVFSGEPTGRRRWRKPLIALLVIALMAGGLMALRAGQNAAKAADATKTAEVVTLEFAPADIAQATTRPLLQTVPISGSLTPVNQSVVKTKVAGEVARLHVREGQAVTQGQILVELDNPDLKARLDAALADQAERRARLSIAEKNRDTNQALLRRQFISQNAYDQVHSTYQGSEAAVQWADAQVALARNALNDAVVRSPISGSVAKRSVNGGERVAADMPLITVVDLNRMEFEATVPAADVTGIKTGSAVHFKVDGFGKRSFDGRVDRINPVTETASRAIKLFVLVDNTDRALRGGMFAEGQVTLNETRSVQVVPISAVREEAGQSYVFTIEDGKIGRRAVALGFRDEATGVVETRSGLQEGMTVVRVAMSGLKVGTPALIKPAAKAAG